MILVKECESWNSVFFHLWEAHALAEEEESLRMLDITPTKWSTSVHLHIGRIYASVGPTHSLREWKRHLFYSVKCLIEKTSAVPKSR